MANCLNHEHCVKECVQLSKLGKLKQEYRDQKAAFKCGPTRRKNQRLTNKLTRGNHYGKRWFPYTKSFPY